MQRCNVFYTNNISTASNDLVFRDSITGGSIGYIDKITTEIDPYTGKQKVDGSYFSAEITVTDKKFYDQIVNLYTSGGREAVHVTPKKYQIKRVVANPSKNATTVIFMDGEVVVVKKSPDDPEADIFSVVAYAVAKRIYGSNSAFQREVVKHLDFIDKEFDKAMKQATDEDLINIFKKFADGIRNKHAKMKEALEEEDDEA